MCCVLASFCRRHMLRSCICCVRLQASRVATLHQSTLQWTLRVLRTFVTLQTSRVGFLLAPGNRLQTAKC